VDYSLFLAKAVTALVFIVLLLTVITSFSQRSKREGEDGHVEVSRLHERFEDWQDTMNYGLLSEEKYKKLRKDKKKQHKAERKAKQEKTKKRLFVLDFDGDIRASAVESLRHEISAILTVANDQDEVLLRLESPGGMVHSYGLASSQLQRLRDKGIPLTIAIDRVAASGGYMMACIGNQLLAAPFAIIGSIGVVAQMPNFHRLLKKHDVDVELHTAGEFKRTLTMVGENTDEGRKKFIEELEETHQLFKEFVSENRPSLDIESIATGEVWYGQKAIEVGLIDELQTSDGYVQAKLQEADVFEVKFVHKKNWQEKVGLAAEGALEKTFLKIWQRSQQRNSY